MKPLFVAVAVEINILQHPTADYCGNLLEYRGIGAGSSPIGCEGFVKARKLQGSSLPSIANDFVGHSYDLISKVGMDKRMS